MKINNVSLTEISITIGSSKTNRFIIKPESSLTIKPNFNYEDTKIENLNMKIIEKFRSKIKFISTILNYEISKNSIFITRLDQHIIIKISNDELNVEFQKLDINSVPYLEDHALIVGNFIKHQNIDHSNNKNNWLEICSPLILNFKIRPEQVTKAINQILCVD